MTNYVKVRKVIVYYSTPCFSLSHWGSKTRPSFPSSWHGQQQSQYSNQQYLQ